MVKIQVIQSSKEQGDTIASMVTTTQNKAEDAGSAVVLVDPRYATQMCSE